MKDYIIIKSVNSYRSDRLLKKKDRITVTVDMPIERFTAFRRTIEAPDVPQGRRKTDKIEGTPHA